MNQFYSEYTLWEDYKNSMYDNNYDINKEDEMIEKAKSLLCDTKLFLTVCYEVVQFWNISTKVNLTNKNCNRRAWLGQAACNYRYKVPEILTRKAWAKMDDYQRQEANKVADKIINIFEKNYEKENRRLYNKVENYSLF